MKYIISLLVAMLILSFLMALPPVNPCEYLQSISVTVDTPTDSGSGVVFTNGDNVYILTARHVLESNIFGDYLYVDIIKKIYENDRVVGSTTLVADVIKKSPEKDLALLKVRKKYHTKGANIYLPEKCPRVGEPVWMVSSPLSFDNHNHVSKGILSNYDRQTKHGWTYVVNCAIAPGSSGGGVFIEDGRLLGIVSMLDSPNIGIIIPAKTIRDWLKDEGFACLVH